MPGENIVFESSEEVELNGNPYKMYVTDRRFIWFKSKGLIAKKIGLVTAPIEQVKNIKYNEKGLLRKKATIEIITTQQVYAVSGKSNEIQQLYNNIQLTCLKKMRNPLNNFTYCTSHLSIDDVHYILELYPYLIFKIHVKL